MLTEDKNRHLLLLLFSSKNLYPQNRYKKLQNNKQTVKNFMEFIIVILPQVHDQENWMILPRLLNNNYSEPAFRPVY